MRLALVVWSLVASTPIPAPSPAPAPFRVTTELDKAILRIFQDSRGTYWFISHDNGLYRRDEHAFAHFTTESGLSDNDVTGIQEDKLGNLFISTAKGIDKFDGRTLTTLRVEDPETAGVASKPGPDALWFGFGGEKPRATYYDGKSLRTLPAPTTADGDAHYAMYPRSKYPNIRYHPYDAYTIYQDSRGHVWFGTASLGACRYDGQTFSWISEAELGFDEKDGRTFGTRSIAEDRDGKFWITVTRHRFDMHPTGAATRGAGGLTYVKTDGLPHRTPGVDEDYTYVMSMAKDKTGDLWMATYGAGVWRYDGKTLSHFPVLVEGQQITVFSIYRDRKDLLWLGTHEHGPWKFNGTAFEKVAF